MNSKRIHLIMESNPPIQHEKYSANSIWEKKNPFSSAGSQALLNFGYQILIAYLDLNFLCFLLIIFKVDTNWAGVRLKPSIVRTWTSYVDKRMKFLFPAGKKRRFSAWNWIWDPTEPQILIAREELSAYSSDSWSPWNLA